MLSAQQSIDYGDAALFVKVVELGSFTAAAAQIGLPKSSLSRRVSRLERVLGARLLQRTTRRLTLTDAGRGFFDRARAATLGFEEAASEVREAGAEPSGLVRMTAAPGSHLIGLGTALARFCLRYPRIRIEVVLAAHAIDLVAERFDLAVRAGLLSDSSLIARKTGPSVSALFAAPSYLERRGRPRALAELAEHDCLLYRAQSERQQWSMRGPSGDETVTVRGPISGDDMAFLMQIASAGAGIGRFPVSLVRAPVERGELVPVLPEYRLARAGLYVVLPSSSLVPSRVSLLRDFLVEFLTREVDEGTAPEAQRVEVPRKRARKRKG